MVVAGWLESAYFLAKNDYFKGGMGFSTMLFNQFSHNN